MAPPPSPAPQSPSGDAVVTVDSPAYTAFADDAPPAVASYDHIRVNRLLYTSAFLAFVQSAQFGWSLVQLNLSAFHNKHTCNARPVVAGTCLIFPGHTKPQWTWVINAWVLGGMAGAFVSSKLSDRFGRKTTLLGNCVVMATGAIVQASASSVYMLALGRGIAGVASGLATSISNGYVSEIAPPHLRSKVGVGYQISVAVSCLLVALLFFVADTSTGWRVIAGFPALNALCFAVLSRYCMVESPAWLLLKGRQQDAEDEIAKLFGQENVALALSWMQKAHHLPGEQQQRVDATHDALSTSSIVTKMHTQDTKPMNPWTAMVSATYRRQTILAASLALALQFSGINAVNFYSSSLFKDAGLRDDRIGILIVNIVNVFPSGVSGLLAARFGNRTMLLAGQLFMVACAVGLTVVLLLDIKAMSIVFVALYVAGFGVSLGPLAFIVASEIFPDELRASGGSLTLLTNWSGTLVIGVSYPYVADALGDLGFVPFIVTVSSFTLFMFKYLPETKGKTSDEIQEIFRKRAQI